MFHGFELVLIALNSRSGGHEPFADCMTLAFFVVALKSSITFVTFVPELPEISLLPHHPCFLAEFKTITNGS